MKRLFIAEKPQIANDIIKARLNLKTNRRKNE